MSPHPPEPLETIIERLDEVLRESPCDATELVWTEVYRSEAVSGISRQPVAPHSETAVLIRVLEGERIGSFCTVGGTASELATAVRHALSASRIRTAEPWSCPPAGPRERCEASADLLDRKLAALDGERSTADLENRTQKGEQARLTWCVGRVILANSVGLRQQAAATSVTAEVRCRHGEAHARAAASARRWADLDLDRVFGRARAACRPGPSTAEAWVPEGPVPVVLAPEASAALLDLLRREVLSAASFKAGESLLCGQLGSRLFDSTVTIMDDGTDPRGLPFPFDLFGYRTRPVEMIRAGVAVTPALDAKLSRRLDRPQTPHAAGEDEHRPAHLFLSAGELSEAELLERADGGVWIGSLENVVARGPGGEFRARARGVQRIRGGELAGPLGDLVWESDLSRAFGELAGAGREPVCLAIEDGFLGGVSSPALALPEVSGLCPAVG